VFGRISDIVSIFPFASGIVCMLVVGCFGVLFFLFCVGGCVFEACYWCEFLVQFVLLVWVFSVVAGKLFFC